MDAHPPGLNFSGFWSLLGRLAVQLMKSRGHAEIHLVFRDGQIQLVRVNRNYRPTELPEV